jgi:hypothetical protein
MIARIWHGYTSPENAGVYENLLKTEVFPSIESKKVKGYKKISLLKRELKNEVEFITIMLFDNLQSVNHMSRINPGNFFRITTTRHSIMRW